MSVGWGCIHLVDDRCKLLNKKCDPGDKGCVLYGKAIFSKPDTPSNKAVKRRQRKQKVFTKKE